MRIRWQQLRGALLRRIRYRITPGGLLFAFAVLMVGFGAVVSANNLLFLILATMLATLLVGPVPLLDVVLDFGDVQIAGVIERR